jgi:hypothetical protein
MIGFFPAEDFPLKSLRNAETFLGLGVNSLLCLPILIITEVYRQILAKLLILNLIKNPLLFEFSHAYRQTNKAILIDVSESVMEITFSIPFHLLPM